MPNSSRTYRVLHLSDTHVGASGWDEDGVDAVASLRQVLADSRLIPAVDVVVVTGDVADDGSEEGCRQVRAAVGEAARALAVPHIYTTGNHDRRPAFRQVLGSGYLGPDGADLAVGEVGTGEHAAVSMVDGLRVVTLDSLVPGQGDGLVTVEQLDWLAEVLSRPAPDGTLVALHHPPVHLAHHAAGRSVLERPEDLGRVLRGRDVHAVLCGHLHLQLSASLEGVSVLVAPGVVTRIDLSSDPCLIRGVLGAGAQVVDLGTPGSPTSFTVQARDPHAGELVYLYDPETGDDVSEGAAAGRP